MLKSTLKEISSYMESGQIRGLRNLMYQVSFVKELFIGSLAITRVQILCVNDAAELDCSTYVWVYEIPFIGSLAITCVQFFVCE